MTRDRWDWITHLPPEEAEAEARALIAYESVEGEEARWDEAMRLGRELSASRPELHFDREWSEDDWPRVFREGRGDTGYSPGYPPDAS
jgi:hypothetical protein